MFPRWLSWLFVLVLAYILYHASDIKAPANPAPASIPIITQSKYPALAAATDIEAWKRRLDPTYAAVMNCTLDTPKNKDVLPFKVTQDEVGNGKGATCGETITIELTVWDDHGKQTFRDVLPLALGSRQLASGLDFGLLGISVGGERSFVLPPYALMRGKPAKSLDAARKALPADKVATVRVKRIK